MSDSTWQTERGMLAFAISISIFWMEKLLTPIDLTNPCSGCSQTAMGQPSRQSYLTFQALCPDNHFEGSSHDNAQLECENLLTFPSSHYLALMCTVAHQYSEFSCSA